MDRIQIKEDFIIDGQKTKIISGAVHYFRIVPEYWEDTLLDLKECYIGEVDFRIFKRNWCKGFASGIKTQLDKGFIELKEEEKFEVSIIDLHPVVKEYVEKNVITNTSHFKRNSNEGYELGIAMGSKYNFMNKKGIE